MNQLVSVIVITYNSAQYVAETLDSIYSQTYENIELIVTDDCSGDNTVEVVKNWMERNRTRFNSAELIVTPINTGTPSNCNRGAKAAKGEWIKIIAGDDLLAEDCLTIFMTEANNNPEMKFITSEMYFINNSSQLITKEDFKFDTLRNYFFSLNNEKQLKFYARLPLFLNAPAFFIKKDILIDINYFDTDFFIHEDMPFIFSILAKGIEIRRIKKKTVKYRIDENSQSRTKIDWIKNVRRNEQKLCFNKYQKKYLKKSNLIDLFVFYDHWLRLCYKGIGGFKGLTILRLFNFYPCYLKYLVNRNKNSGKLR